MGFSNFFKSMMMGINDDIIIPLMFFNIGIEIGQLIIIASFMLILLFFIQILKVRHKSWMLCISSAGGILSFYMFIQALFKQYHLF
jgi:hypothetical protein